SPIHSIGGCLDDPVGSDGHKRIRAESDASQIKVGVRFDVAPIRSVRRLNDCRITHRDKHRIAISDITQCAPLRQRTSPVPYVERTPTAEEREERTSSQKENCSPETRLWSRYDPHNIPHNDLALPMPAQFDGVSGIQREPKA